MPIHVGRQQTTYRCVQGLREADLCRRQTAQHGSAVISAGLGAQKKVAVRVKHVEGFVVSIGPDAHLRVVIERRIGESVTVIGSGGIGAGGNRHALEEPWSRTEDDELRKNPAVGQLVVEHNRIAVIVRFARAAEALPECVPVRGKIGQHGASCLVEYSELNVYPLNILGKTNGAVGVRRHAARTEANRYVLSNTGNVLDYRGAKRPRRGCRRALQHRVRFPGRLEARRQRKEAQFFYFPRWS